jgi:glycosyltransferase involved in cell wall biosynthesis
MNPGRGKKSEYEPARVTIAVLTYLPNALGYFKDRFEVTKTCLEGILKNTSLPYDLMVFDNGSRPEVVDYLRRLRDEGKIQFLLLSKTNIGKIGALQIMFRAAPGEVIAYCDDDVFMLPGWLERHLQVIDTFPNVGVVSGMYIKPHMKEGIRSTLKFAESKGVQCQKGNLVERELEQHYINQMGRSWEKYNEEIAGLEDVLIAYKGIQVWASAGHYQFVTRKETILKALPDKWSRNLMGQMRDLDLAIDNLGLLRLCTTPPTLRLLGNQIDEDAAQVIRQYGVEVQSARESGENKKTGGWKAKFYRLPLVRKIAYYLYERMFKIINA